MKFRFNKGDKLLGWREGNGFNGGIDEPDDSDYRYTYDFLIIDLYFLKFTVEYNIKKYE